MSAIKINTNSAFVNKIRSERRPFTKSRKEQKCGGYHIIDVEQLLAGINMAGTCRKCKCAKSKPALYETPDHRKGLAKKLFFMCNVCKHVTTF